ncbi:DEAD/DEAH box helicase [Janthinobacterium sp. B9-8]|uniref:DEAD/DEAH box helicase n=1 Tax=Janthinobacterium sp. B9-8 TaxID=1236179 RepID=UPI00061D133C|nr:DEAD/DEAH box helicase [Janthinobacterium sp. B9-8]
MPHRETHSETTPNAFAEMGLATELVQELIKLGITTPTPVQAAAVPLLMAGHDVMASAQTGTGKTAAFLLPALHKLFKPAKHNARGPRVLVLTPTRELAEQVAKVATDYCKLIPRCKVACVVGGVPYPVQNRMLAQPYDVLVATPGRLSDLMRGGRIDFGRLDMLVLDEADRMLDMGFIDEVEAIVSAMPKDRQTALFSATLSETVQRFAGPMLRDPRLVEMEVTANAQPQIEQAVHYADGYEHKQKLVAALLKEASETQSIVFTATKADADGLAEWLKLEGFRAAAMHGDLAQRDRRRTLDRLRRAEIDILVATDVAARGIDVAGIGLVLNFDLPRFAEDYIHRVGRTGRAGRTGKAISLVTKNDFMLLTRIRRRYNIDFGTVSMPGLEARFKPGQGGNAGGGYGDRKPSGGYKGKRPQGGGGYAGSSAGNGGGYGAGNGGGYGDKRRNESRGADSRGAGERSSFGGHAGSESREARGSFGGGAGNTNSNPGSFRNGSSDRGAPRAERPAGNGETRQRRASW